MKTPLIIGIFTVAITLIPGISSAKNDDSKYPATNFQPKIIYQDKEAIKALDSEKYPGEKSAYDPKYPATNFEPKVLYQDKEAVSGLNSSSTKYVGEKSSYDPKYPAANFEPKVIYP